MFLVRATTGGTDVDARLECEQRSKCVGLGVGVGVFSLQAIG
jgi:hypothetical protein